MIKSIIFKKYNHVLCNLGGRAFYYVNCKVQSILNENKYILMEPDSPLTEPDDQIYELFTGNYNLYVN